MGYEDLPDHDDRPEVVALFANLQAALPKLEELLAEYSGHSWEYEDRIYRFYHGSFKVYWLQNGTTKITEALQALAPDRQLNEDYRQIISEGTGKTWTADHNERWLKETRPILEAFFHARYMLEMAVSYAKELERPPSVLPSGWAALLYLFGLR
ncbi:MAG TPA: hypothetical protein VN903_28350 [Polyangia bacterium]|jgi:hypothetical protein|nr:hypothetical protein [Polyangia bacterium]